VGPSIFCDAMAALKNQSSGLDLRVLSFQANTSSKDPKDLDGLSELATEPADSLADSILGAYRRFGTPFFGGCCGTDTTHIEALAKGYASSLCRDDAKRSGSN
jgi:methionine synthase I (cobalamin-dependent)